MPSDTKCAKCGGTRGQMIHKVSLLDSDPWLEGVEDVHEFVPTTVTIVAGAFCKNHGTQWDHRCHECTYMRVSRAAL